MNPCFSYIVLSRTLVNDTKETIWIGKCQSFSLAPFTQEKLGITMVLVPTELLDLCAQTDFSLSTTKIWATSQCFKVGTVVKF